MNKINVLDHGFVALRNIAGPTRRVADGTIFDETQRPRQFDADDVDAPNAARMSFDQSDNGRTREQDLRLASYLMRNKHTSPFEMIEVWLEMKLPIFVARQFVRHRTVSINEVSGRYVQLPAEWYIPETVGGKPTTGAKQGQEDNLDRASQNVFRLVLDDHCAAGYRHYQKALEAGVAPEHARMLLSLNHYTHWLWKQDLHNIMHFLSLRDHGHAQIESQLYARAIDMLIRQVLPETMNLYDQFRKLA